MNMKFGKLFLTCRESLEEIDLSNQFSLFYGPTSAGKSTIGHLIDFCLGNDLKQVVALQRELLSVQLTMKIGDYSVGLERGINDNSSVRVTWLSLHDKTQGTLSAPLQAGQMPLLTKDTFCLSDLIFYFAGMTPMKVRKSKRDPDSELVRLSFRDIMWYCYLVQEDLDSSFFKMEDTFKRYKSADVIRFVVGLHSDKLIEFDNRIAIAQDKRRSNIGAINELEAFFSRFQLDSDEQLRSHLTITKNKIEHKKSQQKQIEHDYTIATHKADSLRNDLRILSKKVAIEKQSLDDLKERIEIQTELKSELISAKIKSLRHDAASSILEGVSFDSCPACGQELTNYQSEDKCSLCRQQASLSIKKRSVESEAFRNDLNNRIDDLDALLKEHKKEHDRQKENLALLVSEKNTLDKQLSEELLRYDSAYTSQLRSIDSDIARLEERIQSMSKWSGMFKAIERMRKEIKDIELEIDDLKRKVEAEIRNLKHADGHIKQIEDAFLDIMLKIKFPGVEKGDRVEINRKTFLPSVIHTEEELEDGKPPVVTWNFFDAGSGGKMVLFNVCYALAVHLVASCNNLPLPRFLIIDGPTKNLSPDVNPELISSFFKLLYEMAKGDLADTQFILIDSKVVLPGNEVEFEKRYMVPGSKDNPPLISYYEGP